MSKPTPRKITASDVELIRVEFRERMKDPVQRFRWIKTGVTEDLYVACRTLEFTHNVLTAS